MLEEKTNSRSKEIKRTETYGKRPATMNQTHQVIGTCAAHISWNLRSRDSKVEFDQHAILLQFYIENITWVHVDVDFLDISPVDVGKIISSVQRGYFLL